MKVVHIITGLIMGGAEMMLLKLVSRMGPPRFEPVVVSLIESGPVGEQIRAIGVPVVSLGMRRGLPDPLAIARLSALLHRERPTVVQTWMYHADLIGGLAARFFGSASIAWNIRCSHPDLVSDKPTTAWTVRACARLSTHIPSRIVCCSEASRLVHQNLGYAGEKMEVIPNGFDLDKFRPDPDARSSVRRELRIPEDATLIGLIGCFTPCKDHRTFFEAAARLHADRPDVHFLLCGPGVSHSDPKLSAMVKQAGVGDRCHLLGLRSDMPRIQASLDLASSSSFSEGFSNALGEAMASGVPCVATDVGDSALIVGETGRIVRPRDPAALANAWAELIGAAERLGQAARERIGTRFGLPAIVGRYEALYDEMAEDRRYRERDKRQRSSRLDLSMTTTPNSEN